MEKNVNNLQGAGGVLRATLEITRAATGKKETVELVGFLPAAAEQPVANKENNNDDDALGGRAQRGD